MSSHTFHAAEVRPQIVNTHARQFWFTKPEKVRIELIQRKTREKVGTERWTQSTWFACSVKLEEMMWTAKYILQEELRGIMALGTNEFNLKAL